MDEAIRTAAKDFEDLFGQAPAAYGCAPGRVEVLGNHTDYNEGFILSTAIDRRVVVVGRATSGDTAKVYSRTFGAGDAFPVPRPRKGETARWSDYMAGVVALRYDTGHPVGAFEALVRSDVPLGAGVSSSAALEVATARFLQILFPDDLNIVAVARLCQRAENEFVGMNCGILDQFSSCMGKKDHLVFLDCRDLDRYDHIPLGGEAALVLADTHAAHELVDGAYNRLREACFDAAARLNERIPDTTVTHLRDVTVEAFEAHAEALPEEARRCARHIVTENDRVLRGVEALRRGDLAEMGACMLASHASSRKDFRNSCRELDAMVEAAEGLPGFYGARLSGGGFGGCTVNLVDASQAGAFAEGIAARYRKATGLDPDMHLCRAVDGAEAGTL